jgi:hypothetical protein
MAAHVKSSSKTRRASRSTGRPSTRRIRGVSLDPSDAVPSQSSRAPSPAKSTSRSTRKTSTAAAVSTDSEQTAPEFDAVVPVPRMKPEMAQQFALLLDAGCDPVSAVGYVVPGAGERQCKSVAKSWLRDRAVLAAVNTLNGGAYVTLSHEQRMDLALRHHYAQLAFFLKTTHFSTVWSKEGLAKIQMARQALESVVRGEQGVDGKKEDALSAFSRFALDVMKLYKDGGAPQLSVHTPRELTGGASPPDAEDGDVLDSDEETTDAVEA